MKKNVLIITMLFAIFATSCGLFKNATQKAEAMLIGKWSIVDVKLPGMDGVNTDEMKETIKKLLENSYMEFNADKTLVAFMGKESKGTWELKDDGKTLIINMNSKPENAKILVLTATDLQIVIKEGEKDSGTLILKKQK